MARKQLVDQAAGLKTIELPHADAEHLGSELFDIRFVEVLVLDDLLDQGALLVAAAPFGRTPLAVAVGGLAAVSV